MIGSEELSPLAKALNERSNVASVSIYLTFIVLLVIKWLR